LYYNTVMYLRSGIHRIAAKAGRGASRISLTLVMTPVIALGVPLLWIWLASQLAGNERQVTPSLAIFITAGILITYWVVLLIGTALRSRWVGEKENRAKVRRMSWNRSFRDDQTDEEDSDPIEALFVITAIAGVVAFEIWFFFFAGSPLPSQPLF
jgi:quinol-cytochrome oxidoreductase complex cytochrome b subunit